MPHGTLPSKKYNKKKDRFDELADNIISYMCVAAGAANYLARKKVLTSQLDFKLMNDVQFCENLLENFMDISGSYVVKGRIQCLKNPKYKKEVEKLAEMLVPESTKGFKLYTDKSMPSAIRQEQVKNRTLKDMKKSSKLIIR